MYIINVFLVVWKTSDIPQNALFLIVHTVQTLNNTVSAPYSNCTILLKWTVHHWTSLYIHTDSRCTEMNNMVRGIEIHCSKLKNIVRGYWYTLYVGTKPNNTAWEHWSTLYTTEQHCTGALIYTFHNRTTLSGGSIYIVHDEIFRNCNFMYLMLMTFW